MNRLFIYFFINVCIVGLPLSGIAQIKWLTWEEAMEKSRTEKKKIVVDIYTDWCGWCKKMDKTTFSDDRIVKYINKYYYPVKLDAEQKNEILFNGQTYQYTKYGNRGYHQLATMLLNGKMSFPSFVFLDENFTLIQAIPGYQDEINFLMISSYFGKNAHKTTPWQKYSADFKAEEVEYHSGKRK